MAENLQNALSLYQLNNLIRKTIDQNLGTPYLVVAEIQSISCNRSGHAYLELIEKSQDGASIVAQVRATIWASQFRIIKPYFETTTGCQMKPGIKIMVRCRVSFHEVYGLSINITDILPEYTIGEMALERQRTIEQLKRDGVYDMNRQLTLPRLVQRIAVISSAGAAGYRDFVNQLCGNTFGYVFYTKLFEATVQGNGAEASIIYALERIAQYLDLFDCVVIIRGGGSKSDLQCFDNYNICQNICQFPLPVITGIGHERDESVADLVANTHLKTPTAVAQFLIDRAMECENILDQTIQAIKSSFANVCMAKMQKLELAQMSITSRLRNVCPEKLSRVEILQKSINSRFAMVHQRKGTAITLAANRIYNLINNRIARCASEIDTRQKLMEAKSPVTILRKGYTYTKVNGKAAGSASQIGEGDTITTVFYDGEVTSTVSRTKKSE